ncbi:peptidase M23 [Gordonia sp. CNJ-863]|nr:M23 family metallopeptidase [Gordonia sp. CNJ-863]OLT46537.1 peptidase M23 [Gordonia sp. CNJ-863]
MLDGEEVSGTSTRSAAAAGLGGSLLAAVVLCAAGGTAATALADRHDLTVTPLTQAGVPVDVQSAAAPRSVTVGSVAEQRSRTSARASSRDELTSVMRELAQPDRARPSEPPVPQRPRSAAPTYGTVTSSYGARWGTTHYGLDIANSIGTPVVSTSDGQIIESGPADGFGLWIRVLQDDGTIGVYGHINETLVSVGQRVLAGEQIATVGNRGYSTGPHLHYEVWQQDGPKLDPAQWLRTRGVYVVG